MKTSKITITKLTATDGHVLTNGEAYGKEIYLGKNDSAENWREITDEEYTQIVAEEDKNMEEEMEHV